MMWRLLRALSVFCLLVLRVQKTQAKIKVKVGVLYSPQHQDRFQTLQTITETNKDVGFILEKYVVESNLQHLLAKGVLEKFRDFDCLFDLGTSNEQAYALSSAIGVPLLKVTSITSDVPYNLTISMMPSPETIAQALYKLTMYYHFDKVAILYDARQGQLADWYQTISTMKDFYKISMMPQLNLDNKRETQEALKILLATRIKNVILICANTDMAEILNEALYVGINDDGYKWIASDADTWGVNKTYPSIWGMTGLRMLLEDEEKIKGLAKGSISPTIYASIKDAVSLLFKAVKSIKKRNQWVVSLHNRRDRGNILFESIKKVRFTGLTGKVAFDRVTSERLVESGLDFINIDKDEVKKIGTINMTSTRNEFTQQTILAPEWVGDFAEFVKCHNPGLHLKIPVKKNPLIFTAVIEPPFVQWRNASQEIFPVRNDSLEGFLIDLLDALRGEVSFERKIDLKKDASYKEMVTEVKEKKADAALAPITITAERQEVVDFTKPFYDFRISLIMQKPGEPDIDLFAFLLPFNGDVWLSMIGVVLFVTVAVFAIDYVSPFGYRALARETDEGSGDEFNLFNSLWFATGSMLGQGGDNTPRTPSGRILGAAFWFFILIMISTYTANLAAFFTISKSASSIKSLDDLARQEKIKYGVMRGGSVGRFFETSKLSTHKTMWSHMTKYDTFVRNTKHGVQKVRTENYAYLTDEPFLRYWNQRKPCKTILLNNLLEPLSYGIAMQRDSPYTKKFSVAILKLREKGIIAKLRKKWWDEKSECIKKAKKATGSTTSLGLKNMAGVFIILFGGVLCALVLIIIEIKCKRVVDFLTRSQSTRDNNEEPEPTENLRNIEPMALNRAQNYALRLPDLYANAPESKL